MIKIFGFLAVALLACSSVRAQSEMPLLMQGPTLNASHIVFAYAGELWSVVREGGVALQLTNGVGRKSNPYFSPDGKLIAFTAEYGGNRNVYVMPSEGGEPRQLTSAPGPDIVEGWTPDGKAVLFRSSRESFAPRYEQLYTVSIDGGFSKQIPLPMGYQGSYDAGGNHLAYTPLPRE